MNKYFNGEFLEGKKTYLGGWGSIFSGLAMVLASLVSDAVSVDKIIEGFMLIFTGLGIVGIGRKVEKSA